MLTPHPTQDDRYYQTLYIIIISQVQIHAHTYNVPAACHTHTYRKHVCEQEWVMGYDQVPSRPHQKQDGYVHCILTRNIVAVT